MPITDQDDNLFPSDKVTSVLEAAQYQGAYAVRHNICFSRSDTHRYYRNEQPCDRHSRFSFKLKGSQPPVLLLDSFHLIGFASNAAGVKLQDWKCSRHMPNVPASQNFYSLPTALSMGWYRMVLQVTSLSRRLSVDIETLAQEHLLARHCYIRHKKLPPEPLQRVFFRITAEPRQTQKGMPFPVFREPAAIYVLAGNS
ncbi:hypothetical protein [Microbulbifer sp. 2205BS26-8]|uniref:hypothetical protein n=1 Tax=Microbulbifer sp. 2205BS26-8 TaxID=3064386 RepID=UPI00273E315E|nr:hypothetical protein [Microbulbifer sp. 2205BS26-8]MDP5209593.1 hypothetical protein [Microbulbifer sp. 2205BS26-8]